MNNIELERFLDRLCVLSERAPHDPADFDWPETVGSGWCFSPELVSLYGTSFWKRLPGEQRRRLAFFEAVNFFSLNVHGERYLIHELETRLGEESPAALTRYLEHFVAEEARHIEYFSGFCERYADGLFPDRTVPLAPAGEDPELETILLFARINLFEEIADFYNAWMARDSRLCPVVREINRIHHVEEMRHLAFGRRYLATLLADWSARADDRRLALLRRQLGDYRDFVWTQYYSVDAYAAAGMDDPFRARDVAALDSHMTQHRARVERERLACLEKLGLLAVPS